MSASPLSVAHSAEPALERASDPSMEEILASIRRIIADEQESHAQDSRAQEAHPQEAYARDTAANVNRQAVAPGVPAASAAPVLTQVGESEFETWLQRTANGAAEPSPVAPPFAAQPIAPHFAMPAPEPVLHTGFHAGSLARSPAGSSAESSAPPAAPAVAPVAAAPDFSELTAWIEAAVSSDDHPPPAAYEEASVAAAQVHAPEPVQQVAPMIPDRPLSEPVYAPSEPEPVQPEAVETPLLSGPAGASVQSSFQALARTMFMQNSELVNGAVQDMLRPMLKQWLDDNLPVIVERLVRAEIERVARGGGR